MSEQPPQPSGQLPRPAEAAPLPYEPVPQAPPVSSPGPVRARPESESFRASGPTGGGRARSEAQLRESAGERLDQAADAARRLGHQARDQGGLAGRAEPVAYRVGDSLQNAASYVREHDVRGMREDVETSVRASPLKSLAIATVAGFVLGRMLK